MAGRDHFLGTGMGDGLAMMQGPLGLFRKVCAMEEFPRKPSRDKKDRVSPYMVSRK